MYLLFLLEHIYYDIFSNPFLVPFMVWFMVFNATFNNISVISWRSVLLVEGTREARENPLPVTSH